MTEGSDIPHIKITLRFYGPMRRYLTGSSQDGALTVEVEIGCTLAEALQRAGVDGDADWAPVVGDRIVAWNYIPRSEETITILPPLAGG